MVCSVVDWETFKPIGQATPVPPSPQWPPGFLSGSFLAGALFAPIPVGSE
jgi:hypothetical protein